MYLFYSVSVPHFDFKEILLLTNYPSINPDIEGHPPGPIIMSCRVVPVQIITALVFEYCEHD